MRDSSGPFVPVLQRLETTQMFVTLRRHRLLGCRQRTSLSRCSPHRGALPSFRHMLGTCLHPTPEKRTSCILRTDVVTLPPCRSSVSFAGVGVVPLRKTA